MIDRRRMLLVVRSVHRARHGSACEASGGQATGCQAAGRSTRDAGAFSGGA
jgi:hypothetical protein